MQIFSHRGSNRGITVLFWLHIRKCDNINKKTGKSKDEMKQEPINQIIGGRGGGGGGGKNMKMST